METNNIQNFVELLIALSLASERFVEIIKGYWPWLNTAKQNLVNENKRKASLQILAVVSGMITTYLTAPIIGLNLLFPQVLIMGLLASGGSGFWNAILSYVLQIKEIKKAELNQLRQNLEHSLFPIPTVPTTGDPNADPNRSP